MSQNYYKKWTDEELDLIKNNAGHMTDKELCELINSISGVKRCIEAVRKMRQRLNIKKASGRGRCEII